MQVRSCQIKTTAASIPSQSTVPLRPTPPGSGHACLAHPAPGAGTCFSGLVHLLSSLEPALLILCMLRSRFLRPAAQIAPKGSCLRDEHPWTPFLIPLTKPVSSIPFFSLYLLILKFSYFVFNCHYSNIISITLWCICVFCVFYIFLCFFSPFVFPLLLIV